MFERRLQCLNLEHYQLWAGPESNEAEGIISTGAILMHRAIKVPSFLPSMLDRYSATASATNSNNWIHRIHRLVTVRLLVRVTHCHCIAMNYYLVLLPWEASWVCPCISFLHCQCWDGRWESETAPWVVQMDTCNTSSPALKPNKMDDHHHDL